MIVSGLEVTSCSLKIYKAKAQVSLWEIGLIKIGLHGRVKCQPNIGHWAGMWSGRVGGWVLWFEVPVAYFQLLGMVWSKIFLWEWNKYLHIMQTGGHQGKSRNFIHTWSRQAFWWCFKHQNQLKIYGQPEGLWEWAPQKEEMMLMVMMVTECLLWDPHGAKQCPHCLI